MKATYITFLVSIIIIACVSNTEALTNAKDSTDAIKQEHRQLLKNIAKAQTVEQSLYNHIKTDPTETTKIVSSINQMAQYRNKLFDKLLSDSTTAIKTTPEMEQNNILFGEINDELGKINQQVSFNKNQKFEHMKQAEINNYYNERSKAYVSFFKFLLYCSIPLLIISVLMNRNIIPSMYGNILISIVIFIMIFWGGARYYDIISRNNMNFDEYDLDWEFDTGGGSLPSGFQGPSLTGCIDEGCCAKGTIYDKDNGVCVLPLAKN